MTGTRTLTFATEDGSYIEPVIKPIGTAISLAEFIPARYGYDFDGWYSDPQTKENRVTEFTFNESGYQSPVDILFQGLEDEKPEHIAVRQYKIFKQASGVVCYKRLIYLYKSKREKERSCA